MHPHGRLTITSGEWKLLIVVLIAITFACLFRISKLYSVVCASNSNFMGALVLLSRHASRFEEVHFDKFAVLHQDTLFPGCPPTLGQAIDNGHSISIWIGDFKFKFKDIGKWVSLDDLS